MDRNCPQYGLLQPSRRIFLASAGAFVAWASLPRHAYAGSRDPRFLTIILRGAMDGLAVVPPIHKRVGVQIISQNDRLWGEIG